MSADYPGAQAHFLDPKVMFNSNAHKAIVIHKTGGDPTPAAVYNTFASSAQLPMSSPQYGRSSHFAVGQDGSIWQFVPLDKGAGANGIPGANMDPFWKPYIQQYGNLNTCTISIEHCDPSSSNMTALTPAQKDASFQLVAWLCKKYGIPADHIKPHKSISDTACPGNYPMQDLINFVKTGGETTDMLEITNPWASKHFKETGTSPHRWHCTDTGFDLFAGVLAGWRAMMGAPGFPTQNEQHDIADVAYQKCTNGVVVWDPKGKLKKPEGLWGDCYLLDLDSDLAKKLLAGTEDTKPGMDLSDVISVLQQAKGSAGDVQNKIGAVLKELGIS